MLPIVKTKINLGLNPEGIKNEPYKTRLKSWLAWRDSFQIFDWTKALPVPELAMEEVRQLLSLA